MKVLELSEWKELDLRKNPISEQSIDQLLRLAETQRRRLKVPSSQPILHRTITPGLKAGQVVGVLAVPGLSLEILPKIQGERNDVRQALIRMIFMSDQVPTAVSDDATMSVQKRDLLEVLIRIFVTRLLEASRRGLPHRYRTVEEDLPLVRGKLNITRQLSLQIARPDRLSCIYDELSVDTPLNRVLKAAVTMLRDRVLESANRRMLNELAARLDAVGDSANPFLEPVRLDRSNTSYHRIYQLARMLLTRNWQDTRAGRNNGIALLFEMNVLFEKFIAGCARKALGGDSVRSQARDKYALFDAQEGDLFQLRPDIVINKNTVVDTKWKELKKDEDKQKLGVSQADIYQMLAYAQAYEAERVILLYPWHEGLGDQGVLRRWKISGTDIPLVIATVDVSQPDRVPQELTKILA